MKHIVAILIGMVIVAGRNCDRGGEGNPEKGGAHWITPAAARSIDKGLRWLASRQNDDGTFGAGAYRANVGVCSLAGMAMMAGGSTPGRGPYGRQVQRAVDYVLANAQPSGFICEPAAVDNRPMYGHGFATTFLGRVLRHVAARRTAGDAGQGRQADRQLPERRGRLALSAATGRRRHLRHRAAR